MFAIPDRVVSPAQQAERDGLYEGLPCARFGAESAVALPGTLGEIDVSFIRDASAMTAALIGPHCHVKTASFRAIASGPEADVCRRRTFQAGDLLAPQIVNCAAFGSQPPAATGG